MKSSQKSFFIASHQLGAFFTLPAAAARRKATVHMQEGNFASSSTRHLSVPVCLHSMHGVTSHVKADLWHCQGSHLLQGPLSQKCSR